MSILGEYAIDPGVCRNWSDARLLLSGLGVSKGRLIADYPAGHWMNMAKKALDGVGSVERKRIEELLIRRRHCLLDRGRKYNNGKDWKKNCFDEDRHDPFAGIIAAVPPVKGSHAVSCGDIDDPDDLPWWRGGTGMIIPRTAEAMGDCADRLLWMAKQILFVDPHFDPVKKRFREPLVEFLHRGREGKKLVKVEYHFQAAPDKSQLEMREAIQGALLPFLPDMGGVPMVLARWRSLAESGERMHPRYILTEVGGLNFEYGLDEGRKEGERTDVTVLPEDVYSRRKEDYQANSETFRLKDAWWIENGRVQNAYAENGIFKPGEAF